MVLIRRMLLGIALSAVVGGCIKRNLSTPKAASEVPVEAAWVVDMENSGAPVDPPKSLLMTGSKVLSARNLRMEPELAEAWGEAFDSGRASSFRRDWLDRRADDDGVLLLVELRPYFDNTSNGRYRWMVAVQISAAPAANPQRVIDERFEVPVFLQFTYQGAEEAMEAAGPNIARRLARVMDTVLQEPDRTWTLDGETARATPPAPVKQAPVRSAAEGVEGPIYFVLLDRFVDGDASNNGQGYAPDDPQGWHGGDLAGLIGKLDYLHDLGMRTIWLSPIAKVEWEKAGETGGFHGYWLEDPYALDPHWGTEQELKTLREKLDALDMSLVLDVVTNHTGYHVSLREEKPDWFHHNGAVQDWHDPVQAETFDVHGLPDLAHENPQVREWLYGATKHWWSVLRPDGLRMDAVRHVPIDFWADYNQRVAKLGGKDFVLLGELFDGSPAVVADTWAKGHFRQMFDFPLHYAMVDAFCRNDHAGKLAAMMELDRVYPDPDGLVTFLDNHDLARIRSLCGSEAAVRNALTFMFGVRGMPSITYGTEVGLEGKGEPENRADMRFEETGLTAHLRALSALRGSRDDLGSTSTRVLAADRDLLVLLRVGATHASLVTWNRTGAATVVNLPTAAGASSAKDLLTGDAVALRVRADRRSSGVVVPTGMHLVELNADMSRLREWVDGRAETVVRFEVQGFEGEGLRVVGSAPELGAWVPDAGGELSNESGTWVGEVNLPQDTVLEFKLVSVGAETIWEDLPNRIVHVGSDPVTLTWGRGS